MPKQGNCLITTRSAASWNTIFLSLEKDDSDIVERRTPAGTVKFLRVTEREFWMLVESKKEKKLSFRAFLELPNGQLSKLSVRRVQANAPARDPKVDAMRNALLRQLKRLEHSSVH